MGSTGDELNNITTPHYCKLLGSDTDVCDWYECPYGAQCDTVKKLYGFIQTNDNANDTQFIDGTLFYTPPSTTSPQLDKSEREHVSDRWKNEQ